jgi:Tol biopolymer transport system component
VQLHGNRLVAIVGGSVSVELLPDLGFVQNDDGGEVHLLALDGGADTILSTGGLEFRHPALSPDGRVLLAESLSGGQWDIWRLELP